MSSDVTPSDDSTTAAGDILARAAVDLDGDNTFEAVSADACNTLNVLVPDLTLAADRSLTAASASRVTFEHELTNTGELDDSYEMTLSQVAGTDDSDFDSIVVFYAADGDGVFDDVLTTTPELGPDERLEIRVEALIPPGAVSGESYQLAIRAESTRGSFGSTLADVNTDTVTVTP